METHEIDVKSEWVEVCAPENIAAPSLPPYDPSCPPSSRGLDFDQGYTDSAATLALRPPIARSCGDYGWGGGDSSISARLTQDSGVRQINVVEG